MNYFAHARHFLGDPYFAAGTAVPDWLAVVDRGVRLRAKHATAWVADDDPRVASLAGGILQHFRDDARFHETRAFAETSLALTVLVRDALAGEAGFRPSFLGHLLVEVFLDAALIEEDPQRLEEYYRVIDAVDGPFVQEVVNRMASRPTERLALLASQFSAERFLSDYAEDARLWGRLNQIMRRVKLPPLPESIMEVLPVGRRLVADRKTELLAGTPAVIADHRVPSTGEPRSR